jgi:beta-galactosidase
VARERRLVMTSLYYSDERFIEQHREPMHAPLRPFPSVDAALNRGVGHEPASPWVLPLTPAKWCFHLAANPASAPSAQPALGFDTSQPGWQSVEVPCSWQLNPSVAEEPNYTNVRYPIPGLDSAAALRRCPVPHDDNPVGSYQTTFTLPAAWDGRRVLLQIDGVSAHIRSHARRPLADVTGLVSSVRLVVPRRPSRM